MHQVRRNKLNELPLMMAEDVPDKWAFSKYREIHLGHIHKERIDEIRSVKIVSLPSLVAQSDWASDEIYNHLREAQAQIWSSDKGKSSVIHYYPN